MNKYTVTLQLIKWLGITVPIILILLWFFITSNLLG
jgi:uncharacterized integral membrane protein